MCLFCIVVYLFRLRYETKEKYKKKHKYRKFFKNTLTLGYSMSITLFALVDRNFNEIGVNNIPYDDHEPTYTNDGDPVPDNVYPNGTPQLLLANLVPSTANTQAFYQPYSYNDDQSKWMVDDSALDIPVAEANMSLIGVWKFNKNRIVISTAILTLADARARVLLAQRIVAWIDGAPALTTPVKPLHPTLLKVMYTAPQTANAVERTIEPDDIIVTDPYGKINPDRPFHEQHAYFAQIIAAYVAKKSPAPPGAPAAPNPPTHVIWKVPPAPPAHGKTAPVAPVPALAAHAAVPPGPAPPGLAQQRRGFGLGSARGRAGNQGDGLAPHLKATAPQAQVNNDLSLVGRRVDFKYTSQGQTYNISGLFTDNGGHLGVIWDGGHTSGWMPQWRDAYGHPIQPLEHKVHELEYGHSHDDGLAPDADVPLEFDVFVPACFIYALIEGETLHTVMNTAVLALQAESKLRGYNEIPRMRDAKNNLIAYLSEFGDDIDPEKPESMRMFVKLHKSWIMGWAYQQGMNESEVARRIDAKTKNRNSIMRQALAETAKDTVSPWGARRGRNRYNRVGGRSGGGRGRGRGDVTCYTCGKQGHMSYDCREQPQETTTTQQDFRGGRGNGRPGPRVR